MLAAMDGHTDVVQLLVDRGADIEAANDVRLQRSATPLSRPRRPRASDQAPLRAARTPRCVRVWVVG